MNDNVGKELPFGKVIRFPERRKEKLEALRIRFTDMYASEMQMQHDIALHRCPVCTSGDERDWLFRSRFGVCVRHQVMWDVETGNYETWTNESERIAVFRRACSLGTPPNFPGAA